MNRRAFMGGFAAVGMLTTLGLQGCAPAESSNGLQFPATPAPVRLRAAISHNGLNTIWNQRGRDTAKFLADLLGIEVVSYDGELSVDKQRQDLAAIAENHLARRDGP